MVFDGNSLLWDTTLGFVGPDPASTFYIGINGERRSGAISEEYRMQAMKKVFGEQIVVAT